MPIERRGPHVPVVIVGLHSVVRGSVVYTFVARDGSLLLCFLSHYLSFVQYVKCHHVHRNSKLLFPFNLYKIKIKKAFLTGPRIHTD